MSVGRFAKNPEEAASLALALTRLVEATNYGAETIDRPSFRVDNESLIPVLNVLEHTPYIAVDNDTYRLRLAAFLEFDNEQTKAIRTDVNRILALLLQHYRDRETRKKQKALPEIAAELGLSPERVTFCVDFLLDETWAWAGGNSNRSEPFERRWIQPGENILRHKTIEAMEPTLSQHMESAASERFGLRRAAKKVAKKAQPFKAPRSAKRNDLNFRTPFETYSAIRKVGEGGSATVFEVSNESGERFAIKILKPEAATAARMRRFKNEASFCQRVDHPSILKVVDWGLTRTALSGGTPFVVVPLYPETLRDWIKRGIPKESVLPTFARILDGVEAAHLLGVLHRDIKPENVLLDVAKGNIVVGDFGIAHFSQEELFTAIETKATERLANFLYAAPEQKRRGAEVGVPADIYALGLILNELFTGEVIHGTGYRTVGSIAPGLGFLDELIEAMVRQRPEERPQSIREIKAVLIQRGINFISQQRVDALRRSVVRVEFPGEDTPTSARTTTLPPETSSTHTANEKMFERGVVKAKLSRGGAPDDALLRLTQLRTEGVEIRNDATSMLYTSHLDEWAGRVQRWMEEVIKSIRFISPADSEWFATLDTVPQARVAIPSIRLGGAADRELFVSLFRQHDYRLARLEKLLQKYGIGGT